MTENTLLPPDILFADANASVHFAPYCLEPTPDLKIQDYLVQRAVKRDRAKFEAVMSEVADIEPED